MAESHWMLSGLLPKRWNLGCRIGNVEKRLGIEPTVTKILLCGRWPNNYILIVEDYWRINKGIILKQDYFITFLAENWVLKCNAVSILRILKQIVLKGCEVSMCICKLKLKYQSELLKKWNGRFESIFLCPDFSSLLYESVFSAFYYFQYCLKFIRRTDLWAYWT